MLLKSCLAQDPAGAGGKDVYPQGPKALECMELGSVGHIHSVCACSLHSLTALARLQPQGESRG